MKRIELLAPARTADIGIEAIRHGADAVYIGGPAFGARQAACNTVEDIGRLVEFARPYGVKVYVTVNTLLRNEERPVVEELLWRLYAIGVSAVIVQDPAIMEMRLPPIPLHASTQMDNRTAERVAELAACGFEQVVLARELDVRQIAAIHEAVPGVALEAFVHGALCVGLSGRCYASERMFGRSANRGECAQVCRLKYDLVNSEGEMLVEGRHLLSLKDMNRSSEMESLIDAGVTSFKIEGRLKDMAYVKNVTAYYRQLIDNIIRRRADELTRSSIGIEKFHFTPDPHRTFTRGFTSYMTTDGIAQPFTPKAIGERMGIAVAVGRECVTCDFGNTTAGDGLCFFDRTGNLQGFRVNRAEGTRVFPRPMPQGLTAGTTLYRNQDHAFDKMLEGNTAERVIPVKILFADTTEGFMLSCGDTSVEVEYRHEEARTDQRANIVKQLSRLGDTPYRAEVEVRMEGNWFIPSSLLATWRRELVRKMTETNSEVRVENAVVRRAPSMPDDERDLMMICRHCVRRELGCCPHGKRPERQTIEPRRPIRADETLLLALPDGKRLRLEFDCKNCQMLIKR